jgi:serine/threonine-protein kinase
MKRFLQEARASARIKSPHVVQVADADQTTDGQVFIVLEYLEGRTLRELYADLSTAGQSLSFPEAMELGMQMLDGVEAAHEAGIIHRDLKPDNVMITADKKGGPLLKLLDFGIAKEVSEVKESDRALTRPGSFLGTPEYMAPEQVYSAGSADARSDIFSLGVIVFEMLAGQRPVAGDDPQHISISYLTGAFTRLSDARPDLPVDLVAAVHRAIAPQPADRFASVADLRAALAPFAPPRPASPSLVSNVSGIMPSPAAPQPIPGTRVYTQTPMPVSAAPATDAAAPAGNQARTRQEQPSSAALSPAAGPNFAPDYPSAIGPPTIATPPGSSAVTAPHAAMNFASPEAPASPGFVPEYPPVPAPLPEYTPAPNAVMAPALSQPMWAPPTPIGASLPPPRRGNAVLVIGLICGFLVIAGGVTVGALWYLGWLDPDPPKSAPRKPGPNKPPAKPQPAPQKKQGNVGY